MKFYTMYSVNGALQVDKITEHTTEKAAKVAYWGICRNLENDSFTGKAVVVIQNEEFTQLGDYREVIVHEAQAEPEQAQGE